MGSLFQKKSDNLSLGLDNVGSIFLCSLPRPKMIQTDLSRLINSDEIQKVVRPVRQVVTHALCITLYATLFVIVQGKG